MRRLFTIPVSHFCEKARWAMDLSGLDYAERPVLPGLHLAVVRRHGSQTVPVLAVEGRSIPGSDAITRYADDAAGLDLYPGEVALRREVDALIADFDARLGPAVRLWLYSWTIGDSVLYATLLPRGYGPRAAALVRGLHRPLAGLTRRHFGVTPGARRAAVERIESVLQSAADRRGGGRYLVADRFTAADMAFAALAAPLFFTRGYGVELPPDEALPGEMLASVSAWRSTETAAVVQSIYDEHRRPLRTPGGAA